MKYFTGLDVSVEETSICVIDQEGKFVLETEVETGPDAIFAALEPYAGRLRRALQVELQQRGLPMIGLEAYHARVAHSAMHDKLRARAALCQEYLQLHKRAQKLLAGAA